MNYMLNLIKAPVSEPITLNDVQGQIRVTDLSDESNTIDIYIEAVRQQAESITRRAFITQQWELLIDKFPTSNTEIEIPLPPLQKIDSITYIDSNGIEQTFTDFKTNAPKHDKCQKGSIVPTYGNVWPVARDEKFAVSIKFTCGYGPIGEDTATKVPKAILQWMLLNVANLYSNRETIEIANANRIGSVDLTKTLCDGLIADFRIPKL